MNKQAQDYSKNLFDNEQNHLTKLCLLSEGKRSIINHIRAWFTDEQLLPRISRNLNIKYG